MLKGTCGNLVEWDYISTIPYDNPFNNIELDVTIISDSGKEWTIPSFWRGGSRWSARFIAETEGVYHITSYCSDTNNVSLHQITHILEIFPSENLSPPKLSLSPNKEYLVDENDKPFFWFADTWWMALSKRLAYPEDFTKLIDKRKEQGFNTIMLVAGLFPDMGSFDKRAENEAGLPWEEDYLSINPSYFDEADKRISHIVSEGMIPCILGSWGYYILHMGEEKMMQHWRYIIARWGAYPVVWCVAGEASMPYYLSKQRTKDTKLLKQGWTRLAKYIKQIEAFDRLLTIHPTEIGRDQLLDEELIDINLIQSSHHDYNTVSKTAKILLSQQNNSTVMPLIMGESNYEGILNNCESKMQRVTFWTSILSGSKGYTYGANGVWQVNTKETPFGLSPHGASWGDTPWEESYTFAGATQLGNAKKLLEKYEWWKLKPQPECIYPYQNLLDPYAVRTAGIDSRLRIVYFYEPNKKYTLTYLHIDIAYEAYFWNPSEAQKYPIGTIYANNNGQWSVPIRPDESDWILVVYTLESIEVLENYKKYLSKKQRLKRVIKNLFSL